MSAGTNRIITPLIVVLILATTAPTFAGQIIYVDDDGPADFNNIQAAINDSNHGDTIIVAEGWYFENISFNGSNITLTSTDPCSPDVVAATIIDGSRNGSVVTFNSGEDANCVLDGFTITNGNAERGGGIYCGWPTGPPGPPSPPPPERNFPGPTITNCIISNNSADAGGGMYNGGNWVSHIRPVLTNCTFNGNSATDSGGGMYNYYSSTTLKNCTFTDNSAISSGMWEGNGGGICNDESDPTLTNCTFTDNSAVGSGMVGGNGGGICNDESNPTLTNCTFSDNSAIGSGMWVGRGGGMYNAGNRESHIRPVLTNCTFNGNSATDSGGGMYNYYSSTTLKNCTFTDNSAIGSGMWGGNGGGMLNRESSQTLNNCSFSGNSATDSGGGMSNVGSHHTVSYPTLTNCTFTNNSAEFGGGMYNAGSSPTLKNCTFSSNSATDDGGGMINLESSPTLKNCTFSNNSASYDGGGMINLYSKPTLTNCTFSNNSANSGGGMFNDESSPTLTNCTFNGNSADFGGGMFNRESSPTLNNCSFSGNSAVIGGGIYNEGFWRSQINPILTNCIFSGNSAEYGGGMLNRESSPTLTNCTFNGNTAGESGGGMYNGGPPWSEFKIGPTIINCTFTGNLALGNPWASGGGMYNYRSYDTTVINCIFWENMVGSSTGESAQIQGPPIIVNYSCIQGWTGALGGTGNMGADPCFMVPGYFEPNCIVNDNYYYYCTYDWIEGDYHLLPDSPCINAGDPNHLYDPNEKELDGNHRVIGCRIDMGAFEYSNLVSAEVSIVPRSINLANRVKWITAYLLLPENYNVAEIDFCILLLEDKIEPEQFWFNEQKQVTVARFNHEQLQAILDVGDIELKISAQLTNATVFQGTDAVKVIYEGGGKLAKYGKADNPNPADGATDVDTNADLGWTAHYGATSHDLYFGTANPPPFIGNQTSTTFDPGTMDYETRYYWRIDEVNKWGVTTGQLWIFTTEEGGGKPPGMPGCFPADTPVWVNGAQVQFSKVAAGQKVGRLGATDAVSCFEKPVCLKEIESVLEYQGTYDYYNIVLETGNRINVVNTHYFLTASDRWVLVQNLKVGSKLQSLKGSISIKTIAKREVPFTGRLYDLKIKGGDRYFVGKDGVAVRGH